MNNENKTVELLEMMYGEIKALRSDMTEEFNFVRSEMAEEFNSVRGEMAEEFKSVRGEMAEEFNSVRGEIATVDNKVDRTNIMIEHDIIPKLEALFDGYKQNSEQIERMDGKIDILQVDVSHLKIKSLAQDSKIIDISKKVK